MDTNETPCVEASSADADAEFSTQFLQAVFHQQSSAISSALHLLIEHWVANDGQEERRFKYFNSLLSTPNVNVNSLNNDGITLLECAVNKNLFHAARKLLDVGALVPNQRVRSLMQVGHCSFINKC